MDAVDHPRWGVVLWLSLAVLLAMSLWFSATAIAPALQTQWNLGPSQVAWLTMAVQLGFVVGAIASALLNVPDLWEPRLVVANAALVGAALNAAVPALGLGFGPAVVVRFATGVALALVYPVGMKIMATWTRRHRGLGLGLLVGALTIGSASPHLVRAFGGIDNWHLVMYGVSGLAAIGASLAWHFGHAGPYRTATPPFEWRHMGHALASRPLRLANFGYLGHMWELYAMWTWIPAFLTLVYRSSPATVARSTFLASLATFMVIAAGGLGSMMAGRLADRWGRCNTTMLSMAVSGGCAVTIGLIGVGRPLAATAIALVWGFTIVADSAQFSTAISELADPRYMGTHLTMQTAMGFLLTIASIQMVPVVSEWIGWSWAFGLLALGPAAGITAMAALKRTDAASMLAGGRG